MCIHDGMNEECPGRNCPCPCMDCIMGPGDEEEDTAMCTCENGDCPWCPFGGTSMCCCVDPIIAQGGYDNG